MTTIYDDLVRIRAGHGASVGVQQSGFSLDALREAAIVRFAELGIDCWVGIDRDAEQLTIDFRDPTAEDDDSCLCGGGDPRCLYCAGKLRVARTEED